MYEVTHNGIFFADTPEEAIDRFMEQINSGAIRLTFTANEVHEGGNHDVLTDERYTIVKKTNGEGGGYIRRRD